MNLREEVLVRAALDALRPHAEVLMAQGWRRPELTVYAPGQIESSGSLNEGFAVALIVDTEKREEAPE